jgi:hypothetical protein
LPLPICSFAKKCRASGNLIHGQNPLFKTGTTPPAGGGSGRDGEVAVIQLGSGFSRYSPMKTGCGSSF